jgi:hypothetical protein
VCNVMLSVAFIVRVIFQLVGAVGSCVMVLMVGAVVSILLMLALVHWVVLPTLSAI